MAASLQLIVQALKQTEVRRHAALVVVRGGLLLMEQVGPVEEVALMAAEIGDRVAAAVRADIQGLEVSVETVLLEMVQTITLPERLEAVVEAAAALEVNEPGHDILPEVVVASGCWGKAVMVLLA